VHKDFPPHGHELGWQLPVSGLGLLSAAWLMTVLARRFNKRDQAALFYGSILTGALCAIAGSWLLIHALIQAGLNPKAHAYPAIVWVLMLWTVTHVAVGVIMQLYCLARRAARRMTGKYDIDISNVTLYWHFVAVTAWVAIGVVAGFPRAV
jgi:cytochrome c oxidase subunit I+III